MTWVAGTSYVVLHYYNSDWNPANYIQIDTSQSTSFWNRPFADIPQIGHYVGPSGFKFLVYYNSQYNWIAFG